MGPKPAARGRLEGRPFLCLSVRMIPLEDAQDLARTALQELGPDFALIKDPIATRDYGWVFAWKSASGKVLAGNAPFLVLRDGRVLTLGTGERIETYLSTFERFGDPHARPGRQVELRGLGPETLKAIHAIRRETGLGLGEAKAVVDTFDANAPPVIDCLDEGAAARLTQDLTELGLSARQLPA